MKPKRYNSNCFDVTYHAYSQRAQERESERTKSTLVKATANNGMVWGGEIVDACSKKQREKTKVCLLPLILL